MCAALVKQLARVPALWHWAPMKKPDDKSREERLAEALRANLRRRKMQNNQDRSIGEDGERRPK
jgi:hypothetical protein